MKSRAQKLLERWSKTPEGQAVEAEETQAEVAEREAMVHEIAELRKGLTRDLPALLKGVDIAMKHFTEAQQAQTDAELEVQRANHAVQLVRHDAERATAQLEQQLRAGAIPGLAGFLDELADVWPRERLRWESDALKLKGGARMSARERVDQIRAIRLQAERLFFEPDPAVAERELERLRDELAIPTEAVA